jgi:hypothetical protein
MLPQPLPENAVTVRRRVRRALHAEDWVGKEAVWTAKTRVQTLTVLVRIVDAREQFGRLDCLIETNTGSRAWVSNLTLELVAEPRRKA